MIFQIAILWSISSFNHVVHASEFVANSDCLKAEKTDEIVVDGTCPGEGCQLGKWTAKENIEVFDKPSGKQISTIQKGEEFEAVHGQTITRPIEAIFIKDVEKLGTNENVEVRAKKGDTYYIMNYLGEGEASICFKGRMTETMCGGVPEIPGCSNSEKMVVGKIKTDGKKHSQKSDWNAWWVKVKRKNDAGGWIRGSSRANGSDALA
ncbi:MAG: hypothetical protein ACXWQE_02935 [Bdellovibrionales bacterium]